MHFGRLMSVLLNYILVEFFRQYVEREKTPQRKNGPQSFSQSISDESTSAVSERLTVIAIIHRHCHVAVLSYSSMDVTSLSSAVSAAAAMLLTITVSVCLVINPASESQGILYSEKFSSRYLAT